MAEGLGEAPSIAALIEKLNDPQMLEDSMKESNYFEASIVKWGDTRNELMYQNSVLNSCTPGRLEIPTVPPGARKPDYFVPLLDKNALLSCLTVADVRELATLELPAFGNPLQADDRIQKKVNLRPGSLPGDLYTASIAVEAFIFFVIAYFGAFTREAAESTQFPARGTLFAAFARSKWTLLLLALAISLPLLASSIMSVTSGKWSLIVGLLPISIATLFAYRGLSRHSYFASLRPATLFPYIDRHQSADPKPNREPEQSTAPPAI